MPSTPIKIITEVSARHVHLSQSDFEQLFGKNKQLTPMKPLYQDGQFASWEWVTLQTAKASIEHVRVLGPLRDRTQIEVSLTDAFALGIEPLVRESGELDGTPGLTLVSRQGQVKTRGGVILSFRHIHASTADAKKYGLHDGQIVSVRSDGPRSLIFNNVIVRVKSDYVWRLHLDTDEANAAGLKNGSEAEVIIP
jgi:propanediol utilization protein